MNFTVQNKNLVNQGNTKMMNVQLTGASGSMNLVLPVSQEPQYPMGAEFTLALSPVQTNQ